MRAFGAYRFATAKPPLTLTVPSGPSFHQALQDGISPSQRALSGRATPWMVLGNCRDRRSRHGPAMPELPKHLRILTRTVGRARSIGPYQLPEIIGELGGGGPEFDGGSRKLLNTINDMDLEGPGPFILQS